MKLYIIDDFSVKLIPEETGTMAFYVQRATLEQAKSLIDFTRENETEIVIALKQPEMAWRTMEAIGMKGSYNTPSKKIVFEPGDGIIAITPTEKVLPTVDEIKTGHKSRIYIIGALVPETQETKQ